MSRKVLVSHGFGAGWTSWCHGDLAQKRFMLEYAPFVAILEAGGTIGHDAIERFREDFTALFGVDAVPYLGGIDGSEELEQPGDGEWL